MSNARSSVTIVISSRAQITYSTLAGLANRPDDRTATLRRPNHRTTEQGYRDHMSVWSSGRSFFLGGDAFRELGILWESYQSQFQVPLRKYLFLPKGHRITGKGDTDLWSNSDRWIGFKASFRFDVIRFDDAEFVVFGLVD